MGEEVVTRQGRQINPKTVKLNEGKLFTLLFLCVFFFVCFFVTDRVALLSD